MARVPRAESERTWAWSGLVADARDWILESAEPAARWSLLVGVLDRADDDDDAIAARRDVVADRATRELVDRLPDWEGGQPLSGHENPRFAPNLLNLLADMGLRAGDSARVDQLLELMLTHQDAVGHFQTYAPRRASDEPAWGALLCDSHAIVEVLVRFGHGRDPRVVAGLDRMANDLTDTAQGWAWPCLPDAGFRGPGRTGDFCPQVTLEALRTYARLPDGDRPQGLIDVARVALGAWRARDTQKPYMFGHGKTFKTIKWPPTWYRVDALLGALGRYPDLWRGEHAAATDRTSLAELLAYLIAYNLPGDGRVVPRSTYRGFDALSFGQKHAPSPFATARVLTVLHRFDDLAPDARTIDVTTLSSSKGGSGLAQPPSGPPRRAPAR